MHGSRSVRTVAEVWPAQRILGAVPPSPRTTVERLETSASTLGSDRAGRFREPVTHTAALGSCVTTPLDLVA